jgi:hypothetical protein
MSKANDNVRKTSLIECNPTPTKLILVNFSAKQSSAVSKNKNGKGKLWCLNFFPLQRSNPKKKMNEKIFFLLRWILSPFFCFLYFRRNPTWTFFAQSIGNWKKRIKSIWIFPSFRLGPKAFGILSMQESNLFLLPCHFSCCIE